MQIQALGRMRCADGVSAAVGVASSRAAGANHRLPRPRPPRAVAAVPSLWPSAADRTNPRRARPRARARPHAHARPRAPRPARPRAPRPALRPSNAAVSNSRPPAAASRVAAEAAADVASDLRTSADALRSAKIARSPASELAADELAQLGLILQRSCDSFFLCNIFLIPQLVVAS